jgi:flagellin-like hook-associated protein FlgL
MAISDISLTAGMRANLYSLQLTDALLQKTQQRLSTGKKINSALDDPINYFASQGHMQRSADLSARKDEMSEAVQLVNAADAGIESITTLIENAKSLAQSALSESSTTTVATLETQFNEIRTQIDNMANDSSYKGINLLHGADDHTLEVKFDEDGTSKLTLTGFTGTTASDGLNISSADNWASASAVSSGAIDASIDQLDAAMTELRTEAKGLASNLNIITARQDFTSNMINTLEDGAANLTLADMNEEGANMLMLQTRQALGTTSLSLASPAAQSVLRLF